MPLFLELPEELLFRIIEISLSEKPRNPLPLLLINSEFRNICLSVLHLELRFSSIRQLESFTKSCSYLSCRPRALSVFLPGGTADYRLFNLLHDLFVHIVDINPPSASEPETSFTTSYLRPKLEFKSIQFCLNSHAFNVNCTVLAEALILTDPEEFIWTGPDPAHHFSTAIVPLAARYLFKAMRSWSNLRHLKLTNLSFPRHESGYSAHPLAEALGATKIKNGLSDDSLMSRQSGVGAELSSTMITPQVPHKRTILYPPFSTPVSSMPHLRSIYLGQITHLNPAEIAWIACAPGLTHVSSIRVVDAYQDSIWGPRVRNADVEKSVETLVVEPGQDLASVDRAPNSPHWVYIERIKAVVSCEALTERIMGGDRMVVGLVQ